MIAIIGVCKVIFYFTEKKIKTEIHTPGWPLSHHVAEGDLELRSLCPYHLRVGVIDAAHHTS